LKINYDGNGLSARTEIIPTAKSSPLQNNAVKNTTNPLSVTLPTPSFCYCL